MGRHRRRGVIDAVDDAQSRDDSGFTLIELLIVVTVLPMIIGGLALGLLTMFSLQSSVSNRLGDTGDSQMVSSTYSIDVQSALAISTQSGTTDQCGPSSETQLLGLASNALTNGSNGYGTVISYADVQNGTSWNLVRQLCRSTTGAAYLLTPTSSTTVSYNIEQPCSSTVTSNCQQPPTVYDGGSANTVECGNVGGTPSTCGWIPVVDSSSSTLNVSKIEFELGEPNSTESNGAYLYTLAAVPAAATPLNSTGGSPVNISTTSGCDLATPGTGYYATSLCFLDLSSLTGNNMAAAESYNASSGACGYQMSAALPGGATMYFCLGITGGPVVPTALPTWQGAFLGNSCGSGESTCTGGTPFYTGVGGEPALYQTDSGGSTTQIYLSHISVLDAEGAPATDWQLVSVDAESTDASESLTWTADTPLTILNNDETWDTGSDPVGNACGGSSGVGGSALTTSNSGLTVTCDGYSTGVVKTGAAMVAAETPATLHIQMVGDALEGVVVGVLI
jgi:prepilin-type N-terminal cleavage/methylation domain-containing protein